MPCHVRCSTAARDRRSSRPERRQEIGEARPMFDIYDDFDLQEDFFSEDGLDFDDNLTLETARDAAKVMSVIVSTRTKYNTKIIKIIKLLIKL